MVEALDRFRAYEPATSGDQNRFDHGEINLATTGIKQPSFTTSVPGLPKRAANP
jgi:hypothetical protein